MITNDLQSVKTCHGSLIPIHPNVLERIHLCDCLFVQQYITNDCLYVFTIGYLKIVLMGKPFHFNYARKARPLTLIQVCLFAIAALIFLLTILTHHLNLVHRVRITDAYYELLDAATPDLHTAKCLLANVETARHLPVLRVVVAYFSIPQKSTYLDQIRWCMRSLLEIAETEPPLWRTDLMIYTENTALPELTDLRGSTTPRQNASEPFKCILVHYARVQDRKLDTNSTGIVLCRYSGNLASAHKQSV